MRRTIAFVSCLLAAGCGAAARPSLQTTLDEELGRLPRATGEPDSLFRDLARLDRAALVRAVLERNPSVEAAREAWRAALARADAEGRLEDPMVTYQLAPASIARDEMPFGQMIELRQRFPLGGRLRLSRAVAAAEADAMREDYDAVRLELALMASQLYDAYYLAERSLEVNAHHRALIDELRSSALAQLEVGRGSQQDALEVESEAGELEREAAMARAERAVVVAQINGLLHRAPDAALPRPPAEADVVRDAGSQSEPLRAEALRRRSELRARAARIQRWQSARTLARRDYWPDLEVIGTYNSMWPDIEHQFMVGVALNVPVGLGRRAAMVREAEAELARERAELASAVDDLAVGVEQAFRRVHEAEETVRIFDERILPAARDRLEAARAGVEAGRNDFASAVEAAQDLREIELGREAAVAELHQRTAELDRAVGRIPGVPDAGEGGSR